MGNSDRARKAGVVKGCREQELAAGGKGLGLEKAVERKNLRAAVSRLEPGRFVRETTEKDGLRAVGGKRTAAMAMREQGKAVVIESFGEEETRELGRRIGREAAAGEVYTLNGDLGVGKTVFTQGVAQGLGITEPVNSPTFTILQTYDGGRLPFYHFDVYRIGDVEEMEEIGYEDCFYGQGVCLIEWGGLIREILPEKRIRITIEKDAEKGFDYRRIVIERLRGTETDGVKASEGRRE